VPQVTTCGKRSEMLEIGTSAAILETGRYSWDGARGRETHRARVMIACCSRTQESVAMILIPRLNSQKCKDHARTRPDSAARQGRSNVALEVELMEPECRPSAG